MKIKRLGCGLLYQCHILPSPLVGAVDSVSPPVCPVHRGLKDRDGKGIIEKLMTLRDRERERAVVEDGVDGVRSVMRERTRGTGNVRRTKLG